jgi:hypothetical protein
MSVVILVCCQVEVSAPVCSPVHSNGAVHVASLCDLETSIMRRRRHASFCSLTTKFFAENRAFYEIM